MGGLAAGSSPGPRSPGGHHENRRIPWDFCSGIYGKCRKAYQYKCGLHSTGGFCPLRENGHLFLMGYDGVMDQISHIHRTGNWDMT